ncbi:MAG: enoyl-CoA hydratase/isomerase family protein [Clostridia bacterium]
MASFSTITLQVSDGVAVLKLNRPEARNALNLPMCEDLLAAAHAVAGDTAIRVLFVRAEGAAFCAGADLKERAGKTKEWVRARRLKAFEAYGALEGLGIPVIAVVEGPAIGAGVEIVSICDFAVATPDAVFGTPETMRGSVGATQRLPRIVGKRLAKDMMFTGRRIGAQEALQAGLVTRIIPREKIEEEMAAMAKAISSAPAHAMRLGKRCIDRGVELDPQGALQVEIDAIDEQLASGEWMGKQ